MVSIHCIPAYFPKGTGIYDLHFFAEDGTYLGSEYFDTPLTPCEWYTYEIEVPEGTDTEFITIYLTDQHGNIWGQIAFLNYDAAAQQIISPVGLQPTGVPLTPIVKVWNLGEVEPVSFPVTCQIYLELEYYEYELVYNSTSIVEELMSGEAAEVGFADWIPEVAGNYFVGFETGLSDDENLENDWVEGMFEVSYTQ